MKHITVLQQEAVSMLNLSKDSVVVDCTLGSGGHGEIILDILGAKGTYIGIDVDKTALKANAHLQDLSKAKVILENANFRNIDQTLE